MSWPARKGALGLVAPACLLIFVIISAACGGGGSSSSGSPAPGTRFTLTVAKAGQGVGTVTSSPVGINCGTTCTANFNSGTQVTLTAQPDTNSVFSSWSGDCSGTGSCIVSMTQNRSATATFDPGGPSVVNHRILSSDAASILFNVLVGPNGEIYATGGPGVMSFDRNLNDRWVFQTDLFFLRTRLAAKPDFSSLFLAGLRDSTGSLTLQQINTTTGTLVSEQSCHINNEQTIPKAMERFGDRLFISVETPNDIRVVVTDDLSGAIDCTKNFLVRAPGSLFPRGGSVAVAVTDDSIVVAGQFSCEGGSFNCVWLRAFDHAGNFLWTEEKTFPAHGTPRLVALKEGGATVVYLSMFDFSRGSPGVAGFELHKFSRDGLELWAAPVFTNGGHPSLGTGSCGSFGGQHPADLVASPNGDLVMVGSWASLPGCFGVDLALVIVSPAGSIRNIIRTKFAPPGGVDGGEGGSFDPSDAFRLVVVGNHVDSNTSPSRGLLVEYRPP